MTHRYGPHRPEDAPTHTRTQNGDGAPLHPDLIRQRVELNTLAHGGRLPGKAAVLAAVNDAADPDVKARIDAAIRRVAARGGVFSANDVRPLIPDVRGGVVGARFNAAARSGLIVRVGYVASSKGNTHGHPVAEWRAA